MNIPVPSIPILSQPPPFALPPPNLSIPPPLTGWVCAPSVAQGGGMGGIPFPPPPITSTSSASNVQPSQMPVYDSNKLDKDVLKSPSTIDQQLSMTEHQINMLEQQLNLIQQAQGLAVTSMSSIPPVPPIPSLSSITSMPPPVVPPASFQPNPLIFDLPPPALGSSQQIPIFASNSLLGQPPPMIPGNQGGMNPSIDGTQMHNYAGRF